jgi:hypothetical protein
VARLTDHGLAFVVLMQAVPYAAGLTCPSPWPWRIADRSPIRLRDEQMQGLPAVTFAAG